MEDLSKYLDQVRIPSAHSRVHKDEGTFTFTTPKSEDGLYVSLWSFLGFSKPFALKNFEKHNQALYLRIRHVPKPKKEEREEVASPPKKKPTLLAIGVEGGFEAEAGEPDYEEHLALVAAPHFNEVPLPDDSLPEKIQAAINGILDAESLEKKDKLEAWNPEDELKVSEYAESLLQLDGPKVPPSGWKCAKCDLDSNLWLNLTDGSICCGRRNFDGSGGNGHALDHYKETGYPLAVKLGTITPQGADVFSYAVSENDMVKDPLLEKHLAHWGIDIATQKKTEKTMMELELDLQFSFDWNAIQEEGADLEPCYGPGYTGLQNLGNSCYMNSVLQVLFSTESFVDRFFHKREEIFSLAPTDPTSDFHTQMAKLAHGLLSGEYSHPPVEGKMPPGLRPYMLKSLIGKGHHEFSSGRQQDAFEYFQYILEFVERKERAFVGDYAAGPPSSAFKFTVEERIECGASGKVKYTSKTDNVLSLTIPLDKASNLEEVAAFEEQKKQLEAKKEKVPADSVVRPKITLAACLDHFANADSIPDFFSAAIKAKTTAKKTTRLASFPDYLVLHMRKFVIGDGWVPKKMDVFVEAPDDLDLEFLRGKGLQEGEEEMPEPESTGPDIDSALVARLMEMGFSENRCKRAAIATANAGTEAATNWLFAHMEDAGLDEPLTEESSGSTCAAQFSEESVVMLTSMGFTRDQAIRALEATGGDLPRAGEWIFSHADDPVEVGGGDTRPSVPEGEAKYSLLGFISHIGGSTQSGHYVCHIKKDGKWVIFNDRKVALSQKPPREMAYMYVYKRRSV